MSVVGLGTDIVEISRFDAEGLLPRLAKRILTDAELALFDQHTQPKRYLAKRFAAKEAAVKALGTGIGNGIGWQQFEIHNDDKGKPILTLKGAALALATDMGAVNWLLSIADEKRYAVATVILSN